MDPIINNSIGAKLNWDAFVNKLNAAAPTANVREATFDNATGAVTITIGEGKGAREVAIEVPELEAPGTPNTENLASLVSKLNESLALNLSKEQEGELATAFKAIADTALSASTGSVLFDVYALIALMLQAAQKQRDAAREIRQAENEMLQNAIQLQADVQRDAAITGMIAGLAVCAVQVVAQGISTFKSAQGHKMQTAAMREHGVGPAQKHAEVSQKNYETAQKQLDQMERIGSAQENVKAKETAFNEAQAKYLEKKTPGGAEPTNEAAALKRAKVELETAVDELETAKTDYTGPKVTEASLAEQRTATQTAKDQRDVARARADAADHRLQADERYGEGRYMQDKWHTLGDIFGAIGNTLQGTVRNITELQSAEATEAGADQKKAEEERDQIKDLFDQGREVVRAVLDLFGAIIQAENASMRDAIHA